MTRPYDFGGSDLEANDQLATDELDLPRRPREPFVATDRMPATSYDVHYDNAPTQRFEAAPSASVPPAPRSQSRIEQYQASVPAGYHSIAPRVAGPNRVYQPPQLDAGPGALARLGSIVVCALLTGAACVLLFLGVTGALASAAGVVSGQAFDPAITVWTFAGAVLATFLAMLTARWSGMGVGLVGVTLLAAGVLTMIFPNAAMDLLAQQVGTPEDPTGGLLGGIINDTMHTVLQSVSAVLGGVSLLLGALFFAASLAVHGARGAGWRRGVGRY